MRRWIALMTIALFGTLLSPVSEASDVVEFVDGRYLEVSSYEVHDGWIRMHLSSNDYFVFPASRVSSIKRDGRLVYAPGEGPIPRTRQAGTGKTGTDELLVARVRTIQPGTRSHIPVDPYRSPVSQSKVTTVR